jgi:hypothetical protein
MTSHNEIREIMLTEKMLKSLPAQPAVYAIFIRQEEGPEYDLLSKTQAKWAEEHKPKIKP